MLCSLRETYVAHRYMDAASDAKKVCSAVLPEASSFDSGFAFQASELDPTYAKAWARLGTAKYVSDDD